MWPMPLRNIAHEPQAVWEALKAGNQRVLDGETVDVREIYNREGLTHGQDPRVVVISCSDSRAPIEHVFNIGFGDAFVIRTAGHILDDAVLASLDYALAALKPNLLVVLGHQSCGAVGAACSVPSSRRLPPPHWWRVHMPRLTTSSGSTPARPSPSWWPACPTSAVCSTRVPWALSARATCWKIPAWKPCRPSGWTSPPDTRRGLSAPARAHRLKLTA